MSTDPKKLCADLRDYIDTAKGMLARGEETSLVDLEEKVVTLCTQAQTLAMKDFQEFSAALELLQKDLEELKKAFIARQEQTRQELDSATAHQQASTAYTARKYTGDN